MVILATKFKFYLYKNYVLFSLIFYFFYLCTLLVLTYQLSSIVLKAEDEQSANSELIIRTTLRSPKLNYGRPFIQYDLDGFQLSDTWQRLQDERRSIFDDYEPNYMKRSGILDPANEVAHKWLKLAESQGRIRRIDDESFAFTYSRQILFDNTVWKPGMRWRPIHIPEFAQPYIESTRKFIKPIAVSVDNSITEMKRVVDPYINVWTVSLFGVVFFVGGTTYIGYLAEQGAFDWLDSSQAEVNAQLYERYKFMFDLYESWFGSGT